MPTFVVAPDAIIRYCDGTVWVHTGGPQKTVSRRDPELVTLLNHFATPCDEQSALSGLAPDRQRARQTLLDELKRIGALLEVGDSATPPERSHPPRDVVQTHLGPLVNIVHNLAGELAALGPYGTERVARTGVPLETRLAGLLAGATALAGELASLRTEFVAQQLQQLGIEAHTHGFKLHLGAGSCRLPGWINIDAHPAELALDLRWGLPFEAGSATHIFMSHTFEHFYYPEEAEVLLREIRRVLAPSGRLRLVVPDIEKCLHAYVDRDEAFFRDRRRIWHWWSSQRTRLESILAYAGAGPRPSLFLESHKFGYDFETVESALIRCGYSHVTRSEYMQSDDDTLRVDEASLVAGARSGDAYYSLFVEATP